MVAACRDIAARHVAAPDTGSLRSDLEAVLRALAGVFTHTRARRIVPALLAASDEHPEVADAAQAVWHPRRAVLRTVLGRAIERGEVDRSLDLELAIDLLNGALYLRVLVTSAPLTPEVATSLVALALHGLGISRGRNRGLTTTRQRCLTRDP